MCGNVTGIEQFEDFADDLEEVSDKVPLAIQNALVMTARDFRDELTQVIREMETDKGGTFDSRTSPYTPGGENDSSNDSFHISEPEAWQIEANTQQQVKLFPRKEVEDRAKWMEYGTDRHGPSGDNPMYFYVDGVKFVMAGQKKRTRDGQVYVDRDGLDPTGSLSDLYDGIYRHAEGGLGRPDSTPTSVSGVDKQNFFDHTAARILAKDRFVKNLENAVEDLFDRQFN